MSDRINHLRAHPDGWFAMQGRIIIGPFSRSLVLMGVGHLEAKDPTIDPNGWHVATGKALADMLEGRERNHQRTLMELACERGETHGPDGVPYPWVARGWHWTSHAWVKGAMTARLRRWSCGEFGRIGGSGSAHGTLANIEAAEAWLASQP